MISAAATWAETASRGSRTRERRLPEPVRCASSELPQAPALDESSPASLGGESSPDSVQGLKAELDEDKILSDDSLFDFSELETQMANRSEELSQVSSTDSDFDVVEHKGAVSDSDLQSLHFVNGSKRVVSPNETYFLTTKQFKSLLGIVEDVKVKVKDA